MKRIDLGNALEHAQAVALLRVMADTYPTTLLDKQTLEEIRARTCLTMDELKAATVRLEAVGFVLIEMRFAKIALFLTKKGVEYLHQYKEESKDRGIATARERRSYEEGL